MTQFDIDSNSLKEYSFLTYDLFFSNLDLENKIKYHNMMIDGEKDPFSFFKKLNSF